MITGFVGPNGAGKSTTMRVILGLDAADEGTALIGGAALPDAAPAARPRRGGAGRGRAAARAGPAGTTCCGWRIRRG